MTGPLWAQFRRLLLGTVVEAMLAHRVPVDFGSIDIRFDDGSAFRVPRLDNYMRFSGRLTARLVGPLPDLGALQATLEAAWPELCAVLDLPVGDRLAAERNHIRTSVDGEVLTVTFDLVAD